LHRRGEKSELCEISRCPKDSFRLFRLFRSGEVEMGRYLNLAERALAKKTHRTGHGTAADASQREASPAIPAGAILMAPRFDGGGRPLASVPRCWCCQTPWKLERLQEWQGKTYAFLGPGCACLDLPQALACCSLCVEHCRCRNREGKSRIGEIEAPKRPEVDLGTPQTGASSAPDH
jgi:hypothetical protein